MCAAISLIISRCIESLTFDTGSLARPSTSDPRCWQQQRSQPRIGQTPCSATQSMITTQHQVCCLVHTDASLHPSSLSSPRGHCYRVSARKLLRFHVEYSTLALPVVVRESNRRYFYVGD